MGMKQKKNYFSEKKIQNGRLKKSSFFKIANSQNFFAKISQIRPWVSRIEWCEGHWCSSTYMAVRLSDKSSKTAKKYRKCIFWLFLRFCRTASRPYTLRFGLGGKVWMVRFGRFGSGGSILGCETTDWAQILKQVSLPPISPSLPLKSWNLTQDIEHYLI